MPLEFDSPMPYPFVWYIFVLVTFEFETALKYMPVPECVMLQLSISMPVFEAEYIAVGESVIMWPLQFSVTPLDAMFMHGEDVWFTLTYSDMLRLPVNV